MLNIGIDAGGTTINVAVADETSEQRFVAPGVNVRRDGLSAAFDAFVAAIRQAFDRFGLANDAGARIVIGVAGAGHGGTRADLEERLQNHFGAQLLGSVITDAHLALYAAHEDRRGAIVIVGTGSIAMIRENGAVLRRGGLGYLLGDEASGYALGRAGVRHLSACYDRGLSGESGLAREFAETLAHELQVSDLASLMDVVYGQHFPLQQLARIVLSSASGGDPAAMAIVEHQVNALAAVLNSLDAARERKLGDIEVCLLGGLMQNEYYRSLLCRHALPPGWRVVRPAFPDAATAGLNMARKMADARL